MKWSTTVCIFLLFSCALIMPSSALIGHQRLKLNKLITKLDAFAFQKGGTFSIESKFLPIEQPPNLSVKLYICTERDYAMLPSDVHLLESECNMNYYSLRCAYGIKLNASEGRRTIEIENTNRYRFALVRCGDSNNLVAEVSYEALNPGRDQLPFGDKPLPIVYGVFTGTWTAVMVFAVAQLISNAQRRNSLHYAFIAVLVLKTGVIFVSASYWNSYKSGNRVDYMASTRRILFAASEVSFFAILWMVSKGWHITRLSMRGSEQLKTLFLALCLLFATMVFFSFYSEDYYFLTLMIIYFFMLPKIFSSITKSIRSLESQIWMAQNVGMPDFPLESFRRKLSAFTTVRGAVIVYLGSILLVNSLRIIVAWYWDWLNVAINELIAVSVFAMLVWILRPSSEGLFTDMNELAQLATLQTLIERSAMLPENGAPQIDHWDIRATLVIQYPSSQSTSKPVSPSPLSTDPHTPASYFSTAGLCMAVREDYDRSQKFEASQHRSQH